MCAVTGRRARTAPAGRPEVVAPFASRRLALPQTARHRVDAPRDPVRERPPGRVRVVDDQCQRACPRRRIAPRERGRDILALAAVAARDLVVVRERLAAERELRHGTSLDHLQQAIDERRPACWRGARLIAYWVMSWRSAGRGDAVALGRCVDVHGEAVHALQRGPPRRAPFASRRCAGRQPSARPPRRRAAAGSARAAPAALARTSGLRCAAGP
jgi:hypothetical protein